MILPNHFWWLLRPPSTCLHFPSKLSGPPWIFWIFPKFSAIIPPSWAINNDLSLRWIIKSRLSLIVRVVLNRTVVVDSGWRFFDKLCGSHLQSQSEWYHVSWWYYTLFIDLIVQLRRDQIPSTDVIQQQQSYSGLHSPGRSNSTYFWNDFWVQTFHKVD